MLQQIRQDALSDIFRAPYIIFSAVRFNFRWVATRRIYLSIMFFLLHSASAYHIIRERSYWIAAFLLMWPLYFGEYPRVYPNARGILLFVFISEFLFYLL